MIFKHMDRIVFAGDSVTDMESAQPVGEGLFENCASHSRYFSDELDAQIFYSKKEHMLLLALYVLKYSHG